MAYTKYLHADARDSSNDGRVTAKASVTDHNISMHCRETSLFDFSDFRGIHEDMLQVRSLSEARKVKPLSV